MDKKGSRLPIRKGARLLSRVTAEATSAGGSSNNTSKGPPDRDHLAEKFLEEVTRLYGWSTPGVVPALNFAARKHALPLEEHDAFNNVEFKDGETIDRDERALDEEYDELHRKFGDVTPLCKAVRAPQGLLHFGGKAALTRVDRLALFEDRASGGNGAWP